MIIPNTVPAPKTIQEASRQARTLERAKAIIEDGYSFFIDPDVEAVAVCKPGFLHAEYWLTENGLVCECADYIFRGDYCKHTLAYQIVAANSIPTIASTNPQTVREFCELRRAEEAAQEARLKQMDANYANTGLQPW